MEELSNAQERIQYIVVKFGDEQSVSYTHLRAHET